MIATHRLIKLNRKLAWGVVILLLTIMMTSPLWVGAIANPKQPFFMEAHTTESGDLIFECPLGVHEVPLP